MKHRRLTIVTAVLTLSCALALAGCGSSGAGQKDGHETPSYSQNEHEAGSKNGLSDGSNGNTADLDELIETAVLRGSVAEFQDGSFQVVPVQDDGQMAKSAAPGHESGMESTKVSYGSGCIFQYARINSATGEVTLADAAASNVKKSTDVYVYGEKQDNGEIHAAKVLIPQFD